MGEKAPVNSNSKLRKFQISESNGDMKLVVKTNDVELA